MGALMSFNDLLQELLDEVGVVFRDALLDLRDRDFCEVVNYQLPQRAAGSASGPDQDGHAWREDVRGVALVVVDTEEKAAHRLHDIVAQLGGGKAICKQPQLRESERGRIQIRSADALLSEVRVEGDLAPVDPEQVGAEGLGVHLGQLDHRRSLARGVTARSFEELGVLSQNSLGDGEGSCGLRILFIDDNGEVLGEVGHPGGRSQHGFEVSRSEACALGAEGHLDSRVNCWILLERNGSYGTVDENTKRQGRFWM